ncbi:MAG TPA: chromate efflux transporter [Methylomirabilota bacterium]|nr:chromate efflux transporter [Methylomirabilota bacterium]
MQMEPTSTKTWVEVAGGLLRLGATSYGGPAIIGVMQAELQEKRGWVSKPRFLEGLAVANMLPGATATQLGIFLGYSRGGAWGGLLGGICFVFPAFVIMFALTIAYARLGVTPVVRGALYGLGPIVLGLYAVALCRLGQSAMGSAREGAIGLLAAAASIATQLGIVAILLLAGIAGLLLFRPARPNPVVIAVSALVVLGIVIASSRWPTFGLSEVVWRSAGPPTLWDIGAYFFTVGAFTVGGGLAMIAFIQDQVVGQFGWLTPREFIDGLALGQLTPGPVLMIAAYVGYKVAGLGGAVAAAVAAFLPSFLIMLGVLPVLDRVRKLVSIRAMMKGMAPAVIGVLTVSLFHLAPAALPDRFAVVVLVLTLLGVIVFRVGPFKLMVGGGAAGVLRGYLPALSRS